MPSIENHDQRQWAVFWKLKGQDGHGLPVVEKPIQVRCRWLIDDGQQADPQSNTVQSSGKVIVPLEETEVIPGSLFRKGKLRDVPDPPNNLYSVTFVDGMPNLKATQERVTVSLMRYSNKMPTVLP